MAVFQKKKILLGILTCIGTSFSALLFSQSASPVGSDEKKEFGIISGKIIDRDTKELISYANVSVVGTLLGAISDDKGNFKIIKIPAGRYRIKASFIGYEAGFFDPVVVEPGEVTVIDITLSPSQALAEAIIVTASRKEQTASLAPASVGVITSEDIRNKNITTFDQAVETAPSVQIIRSGGANVQAVSIRGSSEVAGAGVGNRVLLLIDGRPALSPESGGALWNLVPTNSIERVEVVKGAYSSLYGSSAMGGVINVITKKPTMTPYTKIHAEYGFYNYAPSYTGYHVFNAYNNIEFSHNQKLSSDFSLVVDAARKSSDGYKEKSAFDMYNVYGKLMYGFSNNRNLQISSNFNLINSDYPGSFLPPLQTYSVASWKKDDRQERREFSSDLYYYAIPSTQIKYSTRFYFYRNFSKYIFNGDPNNDSTNINIGHQYIDEETIKAQRIGNVTQLDYYLSKNHYLIAGTDIQYDFTDAQPGYALYGKHSASNMAGYVQDEIKLNEKLITTVGLRYDYSKIFNGYSDGNFSPKISLVYEILPDWSVRSLFAQAFRNPSIAERYIQYEQGGGITFQQNPNLKSEKLFASYELGTKFKITEFSSYDISLFWNEYKNLISYVPVAGQSLTFEIQNLSRARMRGFEFNFNLFLQRYFTASFGYTYLDAQDRSKNRTDNTLPYKIKHSFNFSSDAMYDKFSLNVNGRHNGHIREVSIYPGSEPQAFFVLNAKVSYKFLRNQIIYIAVNNITDMQYEEIERYRMPNRSYTIGMMIEF